MLIERISDKSHRIIGESLPDVMRYLDRTPREWNANYSREAKAATSWDMGLGYDGAVKLCATGWRDGGRSMRLVFDSLPHATGEAIETIYSPRKGHFSMGRYLEGNPACFRQEITEEEEQAPIISLVVNNASHGGTNASSIHNYGAAIAAAIEALEIAGNAVSLTVLNATLTDRRRCITGWKVKNAGESLDMAALAFSISHPAALRRITFALLERTPKQFEHYGYRHPTDVLATDIPGYDANTVILNIARHADRECATPAAAVNAVQQAINEAIHKRD